MKNILLALIALVFFSCKKEPSCDTWIVTYWQGRANKTTVTANYEPYNKDETLCGDDKTGIQAKKTIIIDQVSPDLFNYKTYVAKR